MVLVISCNKYNHLNDYHSLVTKLQVLEDYYIVPEEQLIGNY